MVCISNFAWTVQFWLECRQHWKQLPEQPCDFFGDGLCSSGLRPKKGQSWRRVWPRFQRCVPGQQVWEERLFGPGCAESLRSPMGPWKKMPKFGKLVSESLGVKGSTLTLDSRRLGIGYILRSSRLKTMSPFSLVLYYQIYHVMQKNIHIVLCLYCNYQYCTIR